MHTTIPVAQYPSPQNIDTALPSGGSLDPDDWDALRALGHRMMDEMLGHLETVRERPAWRPIPPENIDYFRSPAPEFGIGAEAAYEEFRQHVLPYPLGNTHPRFWGWVIGSGTPFGALAEMVASAFNSSVSGLRTSAVHVEEQVVDWLKELLGYPSDASGLLVSGGSMANTIGLSVAVQAKAEFDVATEGLSRAPRPMVLYGSLETHSSVIKTVRMLGLGSDALRLLPVDDEFRLDIGALERAIAADRAAGVHPFAIVANAGTVNTGAFDDLEAVATLAERDDLWMHVDGAFGAFAALDPDLAGLTRGMEYADSVAFDLHKWMCTPIECGCVLVRNADAHRAAFTVSADYLTPLPRGTASEGSPLGDLGPQISRQFRALKVWMALKADGADQYAALVRRNVDQARYLAQRVDEDAELQRLAPVPLNVVCFRWVGDGLPDHRLDEINREVLMSVQERGIAVPSNTVINGRFALRVAITNHRTEYGDLDLFVSKVKEIAREVADGVLTLGAA